MEVDTWTIAIRRPVKREGCAQYLVLVLLSFAISVSMTRFLLSLTGYPQVGGGELHIAHVLWGGALLFCAALLPLLMSNRSALKVTAIMTGAGVGLFIDEVGKFITQRNDYFYPAAAPIVYILFMLTLLLLLQMHRQEKPRTRSDLCRVLETMQDWIYGPLNKKEQAILLERLDNICSSADPGLLSVLAVGLLNIIHQDERPAPIERTLLWESFMRRVDQVFSERGLRVTLAVGLVVVAVVALKDPIAALLGARLPPFLSLLVEMRSGRSYGSELAPTLYQARVLLEIALGCSLLAGGVCMFRKKPRIAVPLGFGVLLFYLGPMDVILFYFEQFSTIIFVVCQFLLLLGLIHYRSRFTPGVKPKW